MKKSLLSGVWLAAAALAFAQSAASVKAAPFELASYADSFYGQRWWWSHRYPIHRHRAYVRNSHFVYGCGRYNCYDGRVGFPNRLPLTTNVYRCPDGACVYPIPTGYPYTGFAVVVH